MNKSGNLGMKLQQGLSFSAILLRIPKAENVFWPGCALMKLDPVILEKTLVVLRRAEPNMALAAGCCGQPTVWLFPREAASRRGKLVKLLKKQGVKCIYTACPNCTLQLKALGEFKIIPIWPVLAKYTTKGDVELPDGSYIWHDPCPTRADLEQQAAARKLLALSGCDVIQPEYTGNKTRCCGNFRMLQATDPKKSAQMRKNRLSDLDESRTIVSSCEGCLDAFRTEGRDTRHLLELLFGKSKSRGWRNRIHTTLKAPIR